MIAIILTALLSPVATIMPISTPTALVVFEDAELTEARRAFAFQDFQRMLAILKAYVAKDPKSSEGYLLLGISHRALKQYDEAIAALEKTIQLKSKSALAQFELGQTYLVIKNYDGAVKQYRWLENKDKSMAFEFRLSIPADVAKQHQLPPSPLEQPNTGNEIVQSILPMSASLKPEILHTERARYTEEARINKVQGTVVLSAIYSKHGKLIIVGVVRGLPFGLTARAIEAADMIRFKPAIKDGEPVSVKVNIEFNFTLY